MSLDSTSIESTTAYSQELGGDEPNFEGMFRASLDSLRSEGRYRTFRSLSRACGEFPNATYHGEQGNKPIVVWCSNDYLGMGQHSVVLNAMHGALGEFGAGAGGTRNIAGTHAVIVELENELAALQNKEAALVFSSGYCANEAALCTLGNILPKAIFFSDSHNHASMIEGMRHSKAQRVVFKHNDPDHLRELLEAAPKDATLIVAFESLYSMGGDFAPSEELIAVSKEFGAFIYVDETHAVGVHGPHGAGVLEARGLMDQVDMIQGGLGKGFGVVGGFVTGGKEAIDAVRSFGSGFIFTTAIPPVVAAGALASVRYLRDNAEQRDRLFDRVQFARERLNKLGLPVLETTSQILPLMVGDPVKCKMISDELLSRYHCYVQPINYPTVPRGTERLRITPSPNHTDEMIEDFVQALADIWERLEIRRAA